MLGFGRLENSIPIKGTESSAGINTRFTSSRYSKRRTYSGTMKRAEQGYKSLQEVNNNLNKIMAVMKSSKYIE